MTSPASGAPAGGEGPKALGTYLREQHAFLRRTKADVGQQMPPVNRIVDVIDYDAIELRSVDDLAHELAVRATSGVFSERGEATRMLDLRVRHATGVAKAKSVAAMVRIMVEGGAPVVLVGWHRESTTSGCRSWRDLEPAIYTGSESAAGRRRQARAVPLRRDRHADHERCAPARGWTGCRRAARPWCSASWTGRRASITSASAGSTARGRQSR
jgi:hypothetical protein